MLLATDTDQTVYTGDLSVMVAYVFNLFSAWRGLCVIYSIDMVQLIFSIDMVQLILSLV